MAIDRYGTGLATSSVAAVAAFEAATWSVATHRPNADVALRECLTADPDCVAAHALLGLACAMLARGETMVAARQALTAARAALEAAGGSPSERALVDALAFAADAGLLAAANRLEIHLETSPAEFLPAKLAHSLRFMAGDVQGLHTGVDRALDAIGRDAPGHGFLLGCRAFALEEIGAFDAAERQGRAAVEIEPEDAWGIHAVGHVHEMTGRAADGLAWIEARRPHWTGCNNFAMHVSWHAALFHLELGHDAEALALYDREIWPRASDDFRDVANAVALLSRLEQCGVDVGHRWREPAEIAAMRRRDTTLTFAALHNLLSLVSAGHMAEARELVAALERRGATGDDQERVRWAVGRGLSRALLDLAAGGAHPIDFARLMNELPRIGGSGAQRDVFVRTLACLAADRGDAASLQIVLGLRRRLKREDRFVELAQARLAASSSHRIRLSA